MYFSEELYNASRYGYKFDILRGYLFEKKDIFIHNLSYFDGIYLLKKKLMLILS